MTVAVPRSRTTAPSATVRNAIASPSAHTDTVSDWPGSTGLVNRASIPVSRSASPSQTVATSARAVNP